MTPRAFRYAGLAAVATLWSTLVVGALLSGFPVLGDRPLSWMAAEEASALLFSGGLITGALLLVLFHEHVRARYRVSHLFSIALLVGLAGQVVAALVPIQGEGLQNRVHTVAALTLGASLPVLMGCFALAQRPGRWRRITFGLFLLEAVACLVGVVLSQRSVAPLAEILPAVCFHLWIVAVTFAGQASSQGAADLEGVRRSPQGVTVLAPAVPHGGVGHDGRRGPGGKLR